MGFAHSGQGSFRPGKIYSARPQSVIGAANQAHPQRFIRRRPKPLPIFLRMCIDGPAQKTEQRGR